MNRQTYGDIVLTTRVRLARNIEGVPYAMKMSEENDKKVLGLVKNAVNGCCGTASDMKVCDMRDIPPNLAISMAETYLISPEFAASKRARAVLVNADESISVMINEEDHIRLQVLGSGLCFESCLETAMELDQMISERVKYDFDQNLGYLTHCPTNLGTAMRASAMLHLPATTENGRMSAIINAAGKVGIAIRGMHGEGTRADGALYQISNSFSIGQDEREIIIRLCGTVEQIIEAERKARNAMGLADMTGLRDRALRAYGILTSCARISYGEAVGLLSDLRLGASMDVFDEADYNAMNRLVKKIQPYSICVWKGQTLEAEQRDEARAELMGTLVPGMVRVSR